MSLEEMKKKHLRIIIWQAIVIVLQTFLLTINTISWNNLKKKTFAIYIVQARNISIFLSLSLLICIVGLAIIVELRIKYWKKEREVIFKILEEKFAVRRKFSLVIYTTGIVVLVGISAYSLYIMLLTGWFIYWNI